MAVPPVTIGACVSVKPVYVTVLFVPTAAVSKLAVPPAVFKVTPAGAPFNPVKVAVVVPSSTLLAPSGNTSMYCVSGPPSPVKKVE